MTLIKELCQNCFRDCNKTATQSNFCCQECFDEWIVKQHNRVIKAFHEVLLSNTPWHKFPAEMDRRLR